MDRVTLVFLVPFAAVFIAIGAVSLFKPEFFWKIAEKWKSTGDNLEPSKSYVTFLRVFGGIILALCAAALIYAIVSAVIYFTDVPLNLLNH